MSEQQPLIQYTTVSDSVYLWIKNAIIQGEFKPGEHIAQERLTKKLGVSRTPVRDAIKRLETEGLLITKPHCGAVVFQMSLSGCTNTVEILEGLWNKCDSFKSIYYSLDGRVGDTLSEHTRIVQGIKSRDIEETKKAISDHLKDVVMSIGEHVNFL